MQSTWRVMPRTSATGVNKGIRIGTFAGPEGIMKLKRVVKRNIPIADREEPMPLNHSKSRVRYGIDDLTI